MKNEEATLVEMLFEKAEQYGKINVELLKLRTISKTTDIVIQFVDNHFIISKKQLQKCRSRVHARNVSFDSTNGYF